MTISSANIQFNDQGTPVATDFDDVYFSNANGLEETRYVFLQNNQLPHRWLDWPRNDFVIAETGFGTGLNFLATMAAFEQFQRTHNDTSLHTLYYISTEKFPLDKQDLQEALKSWPQLAQYSEKLVAQYPLAIPGCHRMIFADGKVILDLWLGDVHDTLSQWSNRQHGLVDAWFLDGFAPSKNPDMWTDKLFSQMARLSRERATFATFTAAGVVKRGLKDVGFEIEKRKGFGHKRDMLAGTFNDAKVNRHTQRYFYRQHFEINEPPTIAIIGGGMAAANCALALAQKGLAANVYCKDSSLAQGASGNHQGGFYPQLNADPGVTSQVQACGFQFARHTYDGLLQQGFEFAHQWCGVLQISFNDKVAGRHQNLVNKQAWPEGLIKAVDTEQAESLANVTLGYPGLFMEKGGWIQPPQLVQQLFARADALVSHEVHLNKHLTQLLSTEQGWLLQWADGTSSNADIVVLACGANSGELDLLSELPFRQVRGQVESVPSQAPYDKLSTVLCHKGYMTPAYLGTHALGSTYVKQDMHCEYRPEETKTNLETHQKAMDRSPWIDDIKHALENVATEEHAPGRASVRCGVPDHLPMVGAVGDLIRQREDYRELFKALPLEKYPYPVDHKGLYLLTAFGSRGLTTAPLMAELLASQICEHPLPLPEKLLNALNPNRFLIRELIRNQSP